MSLGLMSASRLVPFSSAALSEPVTTAIRLERTALEIATPSTMISGSMRPIRDEAPRIWICPPPPGAPLFMLMDAPMTLPCSALSTDTEGTRASASALTTETAVAAFLRSMLVAWPVTITPSSSSTSRSSAKLALAEADGILCDPRL